MSHLCFDVIYRLAGLVTWEMGFETQDAENMNHMRTCPHCYSQFCATARMLEALDEFGFTQTEIRMRRNRPGKASRREVTRRVEIGLRVDRFYAEMEVLSATGGWNFGSPAALREHGSMLLCPPARLEDVENPETCVEVDPEDHSLRIRLAPDDAGSRPRAWLLNDRGEIEAVPLKTGRRGLSARRTPLAAGKYRIILEK